MPISAHLRRDIPNILILLILYSFQGLPFGLFQFQLPIVFKDHLTYKEIGVLSCSTIPKTMKFLWAPLIELYYFKSIGKRKSWIVPTQLVGSAVLLYLSQNIDELVKTNQITFLTILLGVNTFVITCQDIAVDSWAIEILHPDNNSWASSAQTAGFRIGGVLSTSVFVALSSVEFGNQYLFKNNKLTEPLVSMSDFIYYWALAQFTVTLYILFFVPEKTTYNIDGAVVSDSADKKNEDKEEEIVIRSNQVIGITWDLLKKRNLLILLTYLAVAYGTGSIPMHLSQVYLTKDVSAAVANSKFIFLNFLLHYFLL